MPAVLDSWAGRPISAPLEHSQLIRDLAGGHRHELTENMRSDPGIFNFVKWLRVGEEACPTLEQALCITGKLRGFNRVITAPVRSPVFGKNFRELIHRGCHLVLHKNAAGWQGVA